MAKLLSYHSSNPLQGSASDSNHHQTHQSSSDDLNIGVNVYQEHVRRVVGTITPKAGAARRAVQADFSRFRFSELDAEKSQDELDGLPAPTTLDPRKEFGADENSSYAKEEELQEMEDFGNEENSTFVEEDENDELADYREPEDEEMVDAEGLSPLTPLSSNPSSAFSSPQSSRPPSPDESKTLNGKPEEEIREIEDEMDALYKSVPQLCDHYTLVDRLGTGTFSSVYKAVDKSYDNWDNSPWLGNHPPESSAYYQTAGPGYKGRGGRGPRKSSAAKLLSNGVSSEDIDVDMDTLDQEDLLAESNLRRYLPKDPRVYVAIKRIYNTSSPERIRNELAILKTCRDCRHVSQVITAYRRKDQVVIVMPYQRNMDFREFYTQLHPEGIKAYFRCLLRALRDIHTRGIIHRDVKPANFLYDPFTGIGTLCDFGLASLMESTSTVGPCLHSSSSDESPHGYTLRSDDRVIHQIKLAQREARTKSGLPPEKVGYPKDDPRPVNKANRAGTRGFRAPEVLFKCQAQTGAVDIWSVGVIFLSFLVGKFPLFQSNDDIEALMEIIAVVGKRKAERTATLHGRTLATNVPDISHEGMSWTDFVIKLKPDIMTTRKFDMRYYPHNMKHRDGYLTTTTDEPPSSAPTAPPASSSPELDTSDLTAPVDDLQTSVTTPKPPSKLPESAYISDRYHNPPSPERYTKDLSHALELLECLLNPESTKRILPRDALSHAFLKEPGNSTDDDFEPKVLRQAVCRALHHADDVTGDVFVEVWRKLDDVLGVDDSIPIKTKSEMVNLDEDSEDENVVDEEIDGGPVEIITDENGEKWAKDFVQCLPGQGVAIGKKPCEFHQGPLYGFN